MPISRRTVLLALAAQPSIAQASKDRILKIIGTYEKQGFHRTGTAVDQASAEWLGKEVQRAGLTPYMEPFTLNRVDPIAAHLSAEGRRIEGLPLFDAAFTDAAGIRGRLGEDIALVEGPPNTAGSGAIVEARRNGRNKAIVCITRGGRPGLCPNNADSFLKPFGPPVLQLSSEHADWLQDCAKRTIEVHLVATVKRTTVSAVNITANLDGKEPALVIMTPRSGWYNCASERGGGIACWLELMSALRKLRPARMIEFVASSGHELGHLGINDFVDRRPRLVKDAAAWIHLGANIGAANGAANIAQASDDEMENLFAGAMKSTGLNIDSRVKRGTVPAGEAEVVHRGGGRYVSAISRNDLFHNPLDKGPQAVDAKAIAAFIDAITAVAKKIIDA